MPALPPISVVTPAAEDAGAMEATLRSSLDQGYGAQGQGALEHIVAGPRPASGAADGVVHVVSAAPETEPWRRIEEGFARAAGSVLAWLLPGDRLLPWALRAVGEIFAEHPQLEWLSSLSTAPSDREGICASVSRLPGFSRDAFLDGRYLGKDGPRAPAPPAGWLHGGATFFRRGLWERAGARFDHGSRAADFELWCRLYDAGDLAGVAIPLALRLERPEPEGYRRDAEAALGRLRARAGWTPDLPRAAAFRARIDAVPRLAELGAPALGYRGRRLLRPAHGEGAGRWLLETHAFL